jgi:hypothetical protein
MVLGNFNQYQTCIGNFKGKNFSFLGTPYELVKSALEEGAKAGETIEANYGCGKGLEIFELTYSNFETRHGGVWIRKV